MTTGFVFSFDRPVAIGDVRTALRIEPPLRGALDVIASPAGTSKFWFKPADILATSTAYTVSLGALSDTSGSPLAETPSITIKTAAAPSVVRFRPTHGTSNVEQGAVLSVRFSQSMDRRATKDAWVVTADRKAVAGKVSFAEDDTVLVFRPDAPLPYGATIEMLVKDTRPRSAAGAPLAAAQSVKIRVEAKPAAGRDLDGADQQWQQLRRQPCRRRQLGRGRDVLPAADELHPARRPGHLVRLVQQPRRPQRQCALDRLAGSARRSPGRTPSVSPSTTSAATSSAATPATGFARPATRATSGPRTSAAAPAIRTLRSSARTCSSRASARTTAVTT